MTFIRNSMIVKDSERNAAKRLKSCVLSFADWLLVSNRPGQVKTIFKAINSYQLAAFNER